MHDSRELAARRDALAAAWSLTRGAVLVPAGAPIPIDGTDQYHEFWAHPEFQYVAGATIPAGVVAFDPYEGWTLFASVASLEERVWVGDGVPLAVHPAATGIDRVRPLAEL